MGLILRYIRRHLGMFLTAMFFLSLETMADLLQPTFMSFIVDRGVKGQNVAQILIYGGMMLGIAAVGAIGAVMRNIYATRTSQTISKEMRSDIYRKVQTLSFENIDRLKPASIITRITNDVTQIQNFINGSMRIMMKAPITCVGAIALIIIQTPRQIPMMCVILVIAFLLIVGNMKFGYPRFGRLQEKLDRLNDVSREFLSSVRVVKAFGAEEQERGKFGEASEGFARAGVAAMRVSAIFSPLINLTVNFGIVVLLWLSQGQESREIGRLMASVNYMTQVLFALGMVSNILNTAVRAVASAGRVEEILLETPAQTDMGADQPVSKGAADVCAALSAYDSEESAHRTVSISDKAKNEPVPSIRFEDVTFSYANTSRPALEHITFSVLPGETVGIIGSTGSGKSTLVNLVPRFYDATEGSVLVDADDVTLMSMEKLRNKIAVVP